MKLKLLTLMVATGFAFATGEIDIPVDHVTIKSTKLKIEVSVERMPGGKSMISATYDGKNIPIPKAVIAEFGSIHPQSVHILTHVPAGEIPDGWLKNHPFIISFDYGDSKLHGRDDHEVTVYPRGRINCYQGEYGYFEKAIPEGDLKNNWRLFEVFPKRDDGDNHDEDQGTREGIECPLE